MKFIIEIIGENCMKKNIKRFGTLIATIMIVVAMLPVSALAESVSVTVESYDEQEGKVKRDSTPLSSVDIEIDNAYDLIIGEEGPGGEYTNTDKLYSNGSIVCTAVPEEGYVLSGWKLFGVFEDIKTEGVLLDKKDIDDDTYIYAVFEEKPKATVVPPVGKKNLIVSENEQQLIETAGSAEHGTMKYGISTSENTQPTEWKEDINDAAFKKKEAGAYFIWYYAEAEDGYNDSEKDKIEVRIYDGASKVINPPTGKTGLVYTGDDLQLINAGSAEHGKMWYGVSKSNSSVPLSFYDDANCEELKFPFAGKYYIWYQVFGDTPDNDGKYYTDVEPQCLAQPVIVVQQGIEEETDIVEEQNATQPPKTSDANNWVTWMLIGLIALGVTTSAIFFLKKENL